MLKLSIVIPLYNRPEEISALLKSLTFQTDPDFEVIVVEDGSQVLSEEIVKEFSNRLKVRYFYKENSGPGLSRNYGADRATGNYFIFFDSDCEIPPQYVETIKKHLAQKPIDAFGGPDKAHKNFSPIQKAINYAMTSFITTGGIRGQKRGMEKFHPRSFNMGFSKAVFKNTGGFSAMRFGEDVDLSIRIFKNGFNAELVEEAFVYHKRRTDFKKFFKQVYNSGAARINLYKLHPESLRLVHFFPSLFLAGLVLLLLLAIVKLHFLLPLLFLFVVLMIDSFSKTREFKVALLSVAASFIQLTGYGAGFISGIWNGLILKRNNFHAFSKTFYK